MDKFLELLNTFDERKYAPGNEDVHYKTEVTLQPQDLSDTLRLLGAESNIVKLICRHSNKGKHVDILKAIWFCIRILRRDYPEVIKPIQNTSKED